MALLRASVPDGAFLGLRDTIGELPALFARESDDLRDFVGGWTGSDAALLALGNLHLACYVVGGSGHLDAAIRLELGYVESVFLSPAIARDETKRSRSLAIAAPGVLIDCQGVPDAAAERFAGALKQAIASHKTARAAKPGA